MKTTNYFSFLILSLFLVSGCGSATSNFGDLAADPQNSLSEPTPNPGPTPVPLNCDSNPDLWTVAAERKGPARIDMVNQVSAIIKATHPDWFNGDLLVGTDCHISAPRFFEEMAKVIRSMGVCAWPAVDAIHPASAVPGIAEEYHIVTFSNCQLYPATKNNYKNDWVITDMVSQ